MIMSHPDKNIIRVRFPRNMANDHLYKTNQNVTLTVLRNDIFNFRNIRLA